MAPRVYAERWQVVSPFRPGGQAETYKVRDLNEEYAGELLLKWVKNPKRHDRFRSEVEAIKRLEHPNIVKLIDHSALMDGELPSERQFIVMPFASQGDLSSRVGIYKGQIDGVLQVAKALAVALDHAHQKKIIHRDVKPENILFPTQSHDVWLADFGICLIRDEDRNTPAGEVVGPVRFMAPELEGGGKLDVDASADVYSLGKVIYYMLSGGVVVPRERLYEPAYAEVLQGGQRHELLGTLLSKMVCSAERRISSMQGVLTELERIAQWEQNAQLLPIKPETMSAIEEMKRKAVEVQRQVDANNDIRNRRQQALDTSSKGSLDWLAAELQKASALLSDGINITAGVRGVGAEENDCPALGEYRADGAVELWVINKAEQFRREHLLRFSVGTKFGVTVTSHIVTGQTPSMVAPRTEVEHSDLAIFPCYGVRTPGQNNRTQWCFITIGGDLHAPPAKDRQAPFALNRAPLRSFTPAQQATKVKAIQFSTANWPGIVDHFPTLFQESIEALVSAMQSQKRII